MWLRLELIDLTMVSVGGRVKWSWAEVVPNLFFSYKKTTLFGFFSGSVCFLLFLSFQTEEERDLVWF